MADPSRRPPHGSSSQYNPARRSIASTRETQSEYQHKDRARLNRSLDPIPPTEAKRRRITPDRKYAQTPDAWEKYEQTVKIGQGPFGEVFKAKPRQPELLSENAQTSSGFVAMKRVLMEHEKEGFPITALREIKILQTLNQIKNTYGNNAATDAPIGHENGPACRGLRGIS